MKRKGSAQEKNRNRSTFSLQNSGIKGSGGTTPVPSPIAASTPVASSSGPSAHTMKRAITFGDDGPALASPIIGTTTIGSPSPSPNGEQVSPSKRDFTKMLKRSNTSSAFPKKSPLEMGKKIQELNLQREREKLLGMQQEMMSKQTKAQQQKFEKIIQSKRKVFGNPLLAKEEMIRRRQNHSEIITQQAVKKNQTLHKFDSTDEISLDALQPFPSTTTVLTSSTASYLFSDHFDKRHSSLREIQSPFVSKMARPSTIYETKHFFEEDVPPNANTDSSAHNSSKRFHGDDAFEDEDDFLEDEDEGTDIFASSDPTDDQQQNMNNLSHSASFSFKRSGTFNDLFRADSRSSVLEPSLSMAETAPYDGNPNVTNYFGEEARKRFFLLFNSLSKKFEMGHGATAAVNSSVAIASRRQSTLRPESAEPMRRRIPLATPPKRPVTAKPRLLLEEDEDDLLDDQLLGLSDEESPPLPLHSPRHRFLQLLIKDGKCAPLPIIIRHHPNDDELNLAHRTLGDDYIIYLSAVVQDLPNLTKLNLRDNRLTDRGMGKFIHTLANQQQIQSVDISENKIDSKSAEALTHFLKRRDCTLRVLKMSNADLDDDEVAIFMDALEINQSLLEIDLSHNKLGGTGEKSVHLFKTQERAQGGATGRATGGATGGGKGEKKNKLTGGASVAAALGSNTTLQSLDLSWNKLGLLSAVNLEQALTINHTLLSLNLAYNTMRDEGAEAIGNSLAHNHSLISLDLSHNSIGSIGAFVIATGLKLNSHLRTINMSGNPIGGYGGQALLRTLNYHSVDREILLVNCTFDTENFSISSSSSVTAKVNLSYPTGRKSLDLSRPRNKCTLLELLRLASVKRGCTIRNMEYQPPGKGAGGGGGGGGGGASGRKKIAIKLVRPCNPAPYLGQPYGPWTNSTPRERHPYTLLDGDEWMAIERELYLHDASTGKVFEIPHTGIISFDFFYVPRAATPIECLNLTGLNRLKRLLITHPKEFMSILKLCQHLTLESYQVQDILSTLEEMGRAKEKMEYLAYLLLSVRDTSNTSSILFASHVEDLIQLKTIHSIMRAMFYLSVNAFSGHYSLDLDNAMDRLAGVRLMEISDHENAYLLRSMQLQQPQPLWGTGAHGFTSQRSNRSNFRNESYRRMPLEKGCSDEFFALGLEDKCHGVLEFDFVSIARPSIHVPSEPLPDEQLEFLLSVRGLLHASAAPIQNPRRRRRSRQHSAAGGAGPGAGVVGGGSVGGSGSCYSSSSSSVTGGGAGGGGEGEEEPNPFALVYRRQHSYQRLTSFDEGEETEESIPHSASALASSVTSARVSSSSLFPSSLHVDPSPILGHFIVKKEHRLLPLDLPISPENLHLFLMNGSAPSSSVSRQGLGQGQGQSNPFKDIREEDLVSLSHELNNDLAMYYVDRSVDRFIINLSLRIVSANHDNFFELISFIRKLPDNSHEAYGHGKADDSDKPTKPAVLLEALGLTNDLSSNFEIGLMHPSTTSASGGTGTGGGGGTGTGGGVASLNPTHRKFILNDDIHVMGSEIFVRLRCIDWTKNKVQDRARDVCAKLFGCIGISQSNIRIVNHRTCDSKYSEFAYAKYAANALPLLSTHLVLQQIDVSIEGLPVDSSVLLKTYVYNGLRLGEGPSTGVATAVVPGGATGGAGESNGMGTAINTVWRWRPRVGSDRGAPRLDLNTFPNEFWGFKFLQLRVLIGSLWLTSRQAAVIANEFPQFGYDGQPHRETALLCLWNRIVDLENFHNVLQSCLPVTNHHTLLSRIGWQNVLNMNRVDRLFVLDLSQDDARNMAIMLAKVAQVEPGENFIEPKFRRTLSDLFIPGWSLPASWTIDPDKAKIWDGVPRKGQLTVTYISSGHGRAVVPSIRKYFHEKYSLLAVPRDTGEDFYLADTDPKLWDC